MSDSLLQQAEGGGGAQGSPPSSTPLSRYLGLVGAVAGLVVAFAACAWGMLLVLVMARVEDARLEALVVQEAMTVMALGGGAGLALGVIGWKVWKGRAPRPFRLRRTWPLWVAFLLLLAAGLLSSSLHPAPVFLSSLLNIITLLLLPALILGIVGRTPGGAGGTWRDVIGGLLSGASIGAGLAVVTEAGLVLVAVMLAMRFDLVPEWFGSLLSPSGWGRPNFPIDIQMLLHRLTPTLALVGLLFVVVVTPLIEEALKTLGVGLGGMWLRPGPARAFLLGVASGAGFALVENSLNSAAMAGSLWGPAVFSRLAATLIHSATGGLMGWGWGELWAGKRPLRLLLAFAGAVGLHGVWNGLAAGIVVSGLVAVRYSFDSPHAVHIGLIVALALVAAMLSLATATLAGMVWASRALPRRSR